MKLGASTEDFNGIISINYNCISRHFDEWCMNSKTILSDFERPFLMIGISTNNETDVFTGYLLEHVMLHKPCTLIHNSCGLECIVLLYYNKF